MGAVFSQLIRKKPSTDKRFSGPPRLSQPSFRSGKPPRPAISGNMIWTGACLAMANFAMGRMVGTPLYLSRVQSTGFTTGNTRKGFAGFRRIAARFQFRHTSPSGKSILVRNRRPPSWYAPSCAHFPSTPSFYTDHASSRRMVGGE